MDVRHRLRRKLGWIAAAQRHRRALGDPGRYLRRVRGAWSVCHGGPQRSTRDIMQANLDLVCEVLESENIPYFLVNNWSRNRYRVGVDAQDRPRLLAALRRRCRDGGVYLMSAQPLGARTVVERTRAQSMLAADAWRVFRMYAPPDGAFVAGELHGCDIEFWTASEGRYTCRSGNRVSSDLPLEALTPVSLSLGDRRYPTLAAFTGGPHFEDVAFPVDVVYTWVDGNDPDWQRRKHAFLDGWGAALNREAANEARYLNREELRFSLRSVAMFASFVRRIYIVTDAQVPAWLDTSHPQIHVVDHRDIFDDHGKLPTFNSHAIESRLHHIPGLAEHYLYMNDDVFFGRHVTPESFFASNGDSRFFLSKHQIDVGPASAGDPPVMSAAKNGRDLILERFGHVVTQKQKHVPHPQQRSVLYEMEREFAKEFEATSSTRFRSPTDISPASALHHYYAYFTRRAVPGQLRYVYINTAAPDLAAQLAQIARRGTFDVFCLNDTDATPQELEIGSPMIASFLSRYFPGPSPYEGAG